MCNQVLKTLDVLFHAGATSTMENHYTVDLVCGAMMLEDATCLLLAMSVCTILSVLTDTRTKTGYGILSLSDTQMYEVHSMVQFLKM